MLRKCFHVASIALLAMLASSALARQNSPQVTPDIALGSAGQATLLSGAIHQRITMAGRTDAVDVSGAPGIPQSRQIQIRDVAAPSQLAVEYPALALLAVAIIGMAAVSRRDASTSGDRN